MSLKSPQKYNGQIFGTSKQDVTMPIAVDNNGFLINSVSDSGGRQGLNAIFGDTIVGLREPKFSFNFSYGIDDRRFVDKSTLTGQYGFSDNLLQVSSGTDVTSSGILKTKEGLRYRAGRDAEMIFTAVFSQGVANNYQRIGLFNDHDGFAFGFDGEDFAIMRKRNDVWVDSIHQDNFNKDKLDGTGESGFELDPTKMNIYRINYGYLGIAPIFFEVYGGNEKGWITAHILDYTNITAETHISSPYLPLRLESVNDGNTQNITLQTASWYAGVIHDGSLESQGVSSRDFSYSDSGISVSADIQKSLVTFHNKQQFNLIENNIVSHLIMLSASCEGTKTVEISIIKHSQPDTATFTDLYPNNSVLEYSTDATFTTQLDDGELLLSINLAKSGQFYKELGNLNYKLLPDEYVTFVANSTGASEVNLSIRESEKF